MSEKLQQHLLRLQAELKKLKAGDMRTLESIRSDLKFSLKECVMCRGGSAKFQEEVELLLKKPDAAELSFEQLRADMIFAISLCLYSLDRSSTKKKYFLKG